MALLTNINGKFSVSDAGAVRFNDSFTFPTSDGAANYFLQTNGSGTIGWAAAPTGSGATNRVAYWSTASNLSYNDSFQFDGSHVTITGRLDFVASAGTYGPYITSSDGDDVQIHYNGNDAGTFEIWNHNQNGGAAVRMLKISDTSTATFGSSSLDINVEVTGNIQVDGGFKDSSGDIGTAGQILSSTATGTNWINNGGGTITGSGAANRVAYWTSASNISSDGAFRFDGTNVAIGGAIVASRKLAIYNTNADNELEFIGADYTNIYSQTDSTMAVEVTGSGALRLATTGGNLTIATGGNATFSGSVGIGIAPAATFQVKVATDVNFTTSNNSGELRLNAVNDAVSATVPLEFNATNYEFLGTGTTTFGGSVTAVGISSTIASATSGYFATGTAIPANQIVHVRDNVGQVATNSAGGIKISSSPGNDVFLLKRNDGATSYFALQNSSATEFITTNMATGNVGIGITSPAAKLDVLQETRISYLQGNQYRTRITNTDGNTRILSDGQQCNIIFGTTGNVANGTASEVMRLNWQGYLGIGTDSPDNKLQVVAGNAQVQAWFGESSYTDSAIRIGGANGAGGRLFVQYVGDNSYIDCYGGHGSTERYRDLSLIARNLIFKTASAASPSEAMRIQSDGNTIFAGRIGAETTLTPVWSVQTGTSAVTIPNARYLNFYSGEINYANFSRGFICSISDDTATTQPKQIGLIMHNNSKVNNTFSPGIVFGSQANSSSYSDATAMIAGRRTNQVGDANWSAGQLWFWTAAEGAVVSGAADRGLPDGYPAMVINEQRRVMIGTNTASTAGQPAINQALQIATGNSNDGIVIHGDGSNNGMTGGGFRKIGFRYDETDESFESEIRFVVTNAGAHGGQLEFWTDSSLGTKTRAMTIDKIQRVGIGSNSPAHRLQVSGDSTVDGGGKFGWVYWPGTDNNMYNYIQTSITSGQPYAAEPLEISGSRWTGGNTRSVIFTHQTGGEIMTIMTGGNVGIGDTSAPNKLSVKETSGNLTCRFTSGTTFSLYQNNTDSTVIFSANHGNYTGTGFENRFIWQTTGGTAKMKLDSGTLTVSADLIAYGSPSDKRLKENIKPIESALDKVEKLQGVTFDWKDKKQDKAYDPDQNWKHDIGFIAQDVQKVIPELVRENEDGMLSMRHQGIAPILLEAIKELKAEIEELKKCKCDCKK